MSNNYLVTTAGLSANPTAEAVLPQIGWAAAGGTANALTATFTPANAALTDGLCIRVRALYANTSTTVTLNVDALGAQNIKKNGNQALAVGSIANPGHELILTYNLAGTRWELQNPAA